MDVPETRYARTVDGVHVAYQVIGEGELELLFVADWINHIDEQWEQPRLAGFLEGLARFARVILFNPRGMGASDPLSISEPPTAELWMEDAVAALDAAGSERAAVLGAGVGGTIALLLAATYPARVSSLAVVNTAARTAWAEDYQIGTPEVSLARSREGIAAGYPSAEILPMWAPDLVGNERFEQWLVRYQRLSASPGMALAVAEMVFGLDVRAILPTVRVPTLVLNRAAAAHVSPAMGRYIADHVPGAVYRELPGAGQAYWAGNPLEIVAEVQEFFTGVRDVVPVDRVLATVMFTDIVGSTERASQMGDGRWRELLDEHDRIVRREVERHRGREVETTGDGFLMTFDGPARAIRCALSFHEALRPVGIEIRAGIHTGEVELRGDDITGIGVHIGARVASEAGTGETLVSRTVVDLVAGSGISFEDRGEHELKGVPGTWRLYRVADLTR
jgi:class 3 adenylate cyclase/esterase/lipase